ncbi:MAG: hypothetical protein IEMM0002_0753 [bacterium]|nr:MAG: hypothetical protein IEMM0002_0753 [bacterium]
MGINLTQQFKSLGPFEWKNIPEFSVITGPNGSGKTHLLQLIKECISKNYNLLSVSNLKVNDSEIVFIQDSWNILTRESKINCPELDLDNLFTLFNSFLEKGEKVIDPDRYRVDRFTDLFNDLKKAKETNPEFGKTEFRDQLLRFFTTTSDFLGEHLAHVFAQYHFNYMHFVSIRSMEKEEFKKMFGIAPWKVLNEIFKESGMPFRVNDPEGLGIGEDFQIITINSNTNREVKLRDLSSGEKVLISITFWLFHSQQKTQLPKLILLDEPDAHLEPSWVKKFIDVVNNILVKKYKIRVIMTTHSPTTIAFAPDDSLFERSITEPGVNKITSRNNTIKKLTGGFNVITDNAKYVLVEDEDDQIFYTSSFNIATDSKEIDFEPQLIFISAGNKNKKEGNRNKESGGRTVVEKWVPKLVENTNFAGIFYGLVDKDNQDKNIENVYLLDRHCLENYLCDPLVVYGCLLNQNEAPPVDGIAYGDEGRFERKDEKKLQEIADSILNKLSEKIKPEDDEKATKEIIYHTGQKIKLQKWLFSKHGKKDILEACYDVFGASLVNISKLTDTFKRIRLIPDDLISVFKKIQKA